VGSLTASFMACPEAVPWLKRLVAGLSPRRPGFDPGSVHVEFVMDKVTLWQIFPRVLRFFPVLHYKEKWKKLTIFITGLHNKPQGCGASVASAAGPFTTKKMAGPGGLSVLKPAQGLKSFVLPLISSTEIPKHYLKLGQHYCILSYLPLNIKSHSVI
jgi:hypothetical protein